MCSGCGNPREETFQDGREAEERYEAVLLRCKACAAIGRGLRNFQDSPEKADMAGLYAVARETD